MTHHSQVKSDYLSGVFDRAKLERFFKQAEKVTAEYDFDAFAFRGISGALVAPILAYLTNKSLIAVRKPKGQHREHDGRFNSSDHSYLRVEGDYGARRYIIVDDCRCSGNTVRAIIAEVSKAIPEAQCMGILLYNNCVMYGDEVEIYPPPYTSLDNLKKFCCKLEDFKLNSEAL